MLHCKFAQKKDRCTNRWMQPGLSRRTYRTFSECMEYASNLRIVLSSQVITFPTCCSTKFLSCLFSSKYVKITNHGKSQADLKELVLLAELRHCWHLTEPARHPTHPDHGRIFHQQINDLQQYRNIMQHRKCSNEMNKWASLKIE